MRSPNKFEKFILICAFVFIFISIAAVGTSLIIEFLDPGFFVEPGFRSGVSINSNSPAEHHLSVLNTILILNAIAGVIGGVGCFLIAAKLSKRSSDHAKRFLMVGLVSASMCTKAPDFCMDTLSKVTSVKLNP